MLIIGAGLSGLIAATQFPHARIVEKRDGPSDNHHALLRFRSGDIGKAVNIPFRQVKVHKAIWSGDKLHSRASLRMMNQYSSKVTGKLLSRSIENLQPVQRWVAPQTFVMELQNSLHNRITYKFKDQFIHTAKEPIVSTMPMFALADFVNDESLRNVNFNYSPINVRRYRIANADVFQTIYFPDDDTSTYRASITGDTLIVESMGNVGVLHPAMICAIFGAKAYEPLDDVTQKFGKIAPIEEAHRQAFIMRMTMEHHIYSLGRFATWRNILLDDVLIDIERIKAMLQMGSYHRYLKGASK